LWIATSKLVKYILGYDYFEYPNLAILNYAVSTPIYVSRVAEGKEVTRPT